MSTPSPCAICIHTSSMATGLRAVPSRWRRSWDSATGDWTGSPYALVLNYSVIGRANNMQSALYIQQFVLTLQPYYYNMAQQY